MRSCGSVCSELSRCWTPGDQAPTARSGVTVRQGRRPAAPEVDRRSPRALMHRVGPEGNPLSNKITDNL